MNTITSHFVERPHDHNTWRSFWFGMSALFALPAIRILMIGINQVINRNSQGSPTAVSPGMLTAVVSLALSIAGLLYGVKAMRLGEHSWVVWTGLFISAVVMLFWMAIFIGELVFPH